MKSKKSSKISNLFCLYGNFYTKLKLITLTEDEEEDGKALEVVLLHVEVYSQESYYGPHKNRC